MKPLDPPFFIFGCGRSGTSLLSRMLNEHPRLAVPNESHLFDTFGPLRRWYGDLREVENRARLAADMLPAVAARRWSPPLRSDQVLAAVRACDPVRDGHLGGVVDAVLRSWAQSQGKSRWGEKTPGHLFSWPEISGWLPHAQAIHIIRDGRDVALSWIRAPFGPKTVHSAARL